MCNSLKYECPIIGIAWFEDIHNTECLCCIFRNKVIVKLLNATWLHAAARNTSFSITHLILN